MNVEKLSKNPHYKLNKFEKSQLRVQTQELRQDDEGVVAPKPKRKRKKKKLSQ